MNKKWIYIEPSVFIWQDREQYLFYNSLNGKKVFIKKNNTIDPIIQSLCIEKNSYSAKLEEDIVNTEDFLDFIKVLSSNKIGNLATCSDSERPVNIPPKLILGNPIESTNNTEDYLDKKILDNVNELNIQLSGRCNLNCTNCGEYNMQLVHCFKSEHTLSNQNIKNLANQVKHLNLQKLIITGGDILALENFDFIIGVFKTIYVMKIYDIHYKQIDLNKIQYVLDHDETSLVRISVHCDDIDKTALLEQIGNIGRYNSRVLWSFVVSSEEELELCYSILDQCKSIHNEIKPFYNKGNEEFIKEFVFIDNEDIEGINLDKRQIFANQMINRNYFGKITIQADGQVFDNVNFGAVGNIYDCLEDNVHKIIRDGRSWRWTRCNDQCDDCLYRLICPPPCNLELAMNSKTICQQPKNYKTM